MFGGGAKWPFFQLALVLVGFQVAAIGFVIGSGNWGATAPAPLIKLNPLWQHFGQDTILVPAGWFDRMQQASTWRTGANMMVWCAIQWLGGALALDFLRQQSR